MTTSLIVAMDRRGVIGRDGGLPWRLSADLVRFRKLTMGHTLVMGRKTYDSIGRPLPGRTSIVITRQPAYQPVGVTVAHSLDEALKQASSDSEVFIIGGAEIYAQALSKVDRLHITRVQAEVEGDTYFPEIDWTAWDKIESTPHSPDEKNAHPYTFEIYQRK